MTPQTFIWAAVDQERDLALLTGRGVGGLLADAGITKRWSASGKGYVVTLPELSDIACWCTEERIPYRERAR
ncbi:hypothetical protein [Kribbella sp. NPDC004536]|uniref:hypothetical protein n=1 Tax=Kribbella sp. NPDC004536 TaxID=3364106 RepID=UPI00368140DC